MRVHWRFILDTNNISKSKKIESKIIDQLHGMQSQVVIREKYWKDETKYLLEVQSDFIEDNVLESLFYIIARFSSSWHMNISQGRMEDISGTCDAPSFLGLSWVSFSLR